MLSAAWRRAVSPVPRTSASWALPWSWPTQCVVCRGLGPQRLCAPCVGSFLRPIPRCNSCALALTNEDNTLQRDVCHHCWQALPPQASTVAAVCFEFPWAGLLTRFKTPLGLGLAQPLAALTTQAVLTHQRHPPGGQLPIDWVLPMPASPQRLRARGYNPAWELARRIAPALSLPTCSHLLLKLVDAAPQRGLSRDERLHNLQGTLGVAPQHAHRVQGQRVALVDDVMTTGASVHEAARALLAAGADEVHAWVVARTPERGSDTDG
jgi:ComF family protein